MFPMFTWGAETLAVQQEGADRKWATFTAVGKEQRPFVGRREAVLLEHDGRGFLTHMWFGGSFPNFALLRIRVYVDLEAQASIDMELGMGTGFGFEGSNAPWGNKYFGKTGSPSGIFNFYRIPFSSHIRVTAELPNGVPDDQVFWWIVRGLENAPLEVAGRALPPGARLRLYKNEHLHVEPLAEFELCNTRKSGMLFQVAMAAKSERFDFMEAMMRAYLGQTGALQLLSSGLEDYFLGTYYFNRGLYHLPQAGLTHKDEKNATFSAYRFHDEDPIVFRDGFRLTCRCGEQQGDKVFGPTGKPAATTYTTYAWTYEW
jgi:Protein of unknown function (DUF2961)